MTHPIAAAKRGGVVEHTTNAPVSINVWLGNDGTDPAIRSGRCHI
jgi:hypothetical protein